MLTLLQAAHEVRCGQGDHRGGWYAVIHVGNEAFAVELCDLCFVELTNRWRLLGPAEAVKRLKNKRTIVPGK